MDPVDMATPHPYRPQRRRRYKQIHVAKPAIWDGTSYVRIKTGQGWAVSGCRSASTDQSACHPTHSGSTSCGKMCTVTLMAMPWQHLIPFRS